MLRRKVPECFSGWNDAVAPRMIVHSWVLSIVSNSEPTAIARASMVPSSDPRHGCIGGAPCRIGQRRLSAIAVPVCERIVVRRFLRAARQESAAPVLVAWSGSETKPVSLSLGAAAGTEDESFADSHAGRRAYHASWRVMDRGTFPPSCSCRPPHGKRRGRPVLPARRCRLADTRRGLLLTPIKKHGSFFFSSLSLFLF